MAPHIVMAPVYSYGLPRRRRLDRRVRALYRREARGRVALVRDAAAVEPAAADELPDDVGRPRPAPTRRALPFGTRPRRGASPRFMA